MSNPYNLAKDICKSLFDAGYIAYFAGGWVRDLLLQQKTDEIDIATSAPPHVIQNLFPKTIPVGIAFGVVIVVIEGVNFEVTTFRKDHPYHDGRHPEGVDFSTPEKDAQRRDFTINGMFYDPLTDTLYDYVEGQKDLQKKIIRAIGKPIDRFVEDRLRMVRAVRFAARLDFKIEEKTAEAILACASTLFPSVSMERVWQELCKMAAYPHLDRAILLLQHFGLLGAIFPHLQTASAKEIEKRVLPFPYFPIETPPIAYLLELFPSFSLEEKLNLSDYLKLPHQDKKLIEFFASAQAFLSRENQEPYDWAYFYAHALSELYLQITAAKNPEMRAGFLEEHDQRRSALKKHILRIQKKEPLLTAAHLMQKGITPGQKMGLLLKEGERIAINNDYDTIEPILKALKLQ